MAEKKLAGRVALVTGGGKRIGRSIALRLAAEGATVAVNYRTSQTEADSVVREIESLPDAVVSKGSKRVLAVQADVTCRSEVAKMFATIEKEFGRLDILVNNAG